MLVVTARFIAGVALPWTFDVPKDGNVALGGTVGWNVGSCILLNLVDEIRVLADGLDAEASAEMGELLALEAVKRIGRE